MSETQSSPPVDLGIYGRVQSRPGLHPTDRLALVASAAWILAAIVFLWIAGLGDGGSLGPLRFLIVVLALFLPVALIWIAAIAVKSARVIREESERLQASMDAMRQIYISQAQIAATTMGPNVERKIDEIVKAQKRAEDALTNFAMPTRAPEPIVEPEAAAPAPLLEPDPQQLLELAAVDPIPPVSNEDFISALNFPETAEDREGFASLKKALAHPQMAVVVRASQDVLTLLSQDGIYMDDLAPERARPELWRKFAEGDRGPEISGIGGIRDRSSLALSAARMRQDTIFRDSVHHFLRAFDRMLSTTVEALTDQEMIKLTDTRTARAFMLLGRVAGIFDR